MMRTMRSIAPWIMLIVAVSFVGWMVFEVGMDVTGQAGGAGDEILSINGDGVNVQEFYLAVRATQDQQRRSGPSGQSSAARSVRPSNSVISKRTLNITRPKTARASWKRRYA